MILFLSLPALICLLQRRSLPSLEIFGKGRERKEKEKERTSPSELSFHSVFCQNIFLEISVCACRLFLFHPLISLLFLSFQPIAFPLLWRVTLRSSSFTTEIDANRRKSYPIREVPKIIQISQRQYPFFPFVTCKNYNKSGIIEIQHFIIIPPFSWDREIDIHTISKKEG